jgi:hypothetical protein
LQALPFLLKDFVKEEVEDINKAIDERGLNLPHAKDPSDSILFVLNQFLEWYNHVRQPMYDTEDIKDIALKTERLQKLLKFVFPDRSGVMCVLCVCVLSVCCVCAPGMLLDLCAVCVLSVCCVCVLMCCG